MTYLNCNFLFISQGKSLFNENKSLSLQDGNRHQVDDKVDAEEESFFFCGIRSKKTKKNHLEIPSVDILYEEVTSSHMGNAIAKWNETYNPQGIIILIDSLYLSAFYEVKLTQIIYL